MMILSRFSTLDIEQPAPEELMDSPSPDLLEEILSALSSAYNDEASDSESYLSTDSVGKENFTFGAVDPAEFLVELAKWVPNIQKEFVDRLSKVYVPGMDSANIKMDTNETYELQKAARALDNNWHSWSDYGVYLENSQGYPYFRVFPNEQEMAMVKEHPEELFILCVYVK